MLVMGLDWWRVQRAGEAVETLLDPRRPDGWVASDEDRETQPFGVSVCEDLSALRRYIREYSMSVRPGDRLVRVVGVLSPDQDRDMAAARVIASEVEVIGDARAWLAGELRLEGDYDAPEVDEDEDEDEE